MKRRGEAVYKPATKELVEIVRQNLIKASKARAAEKKAEQDSQIFYELDDEDMEMQAGPSQPVSQPAASARLAVAAGRTIKKTFNLEQASFTGIVS